MAGGKAYHRYFEGYSERKVWDSGKQRFKLETYYSGDYYQAQAAPEEKAKRKKIYLAGYICAVLIFLFAGTRKTVSAASVITALPTMAILLGLLWQIPSLISYLQMKELLVLRQYRERKNFMSLCMGLACFFGANAAIHLGCSVYYGSVADWLEWLTIAGMLIDAGIFFGIYRMEKALVYLIVPNEAKIPEDCYDISLREN